MFKLVPNYSLKENNTFGLDVRADYWLTISAPEDLEPAFSAFPHLVGEEKLIIGGGSNLLFLSDFDGLIISPDISCFEVMHEDNDIVEVEVGAGADWDDFVAACVQKNWFGAENLSWIPGKVGAAPVQNIGAYGAEVSSIIKVVKGVNLTTGHQEHYSQEECQFSYRSSIFKEQLLNRFLVTSVIFQLRKNGELSTGYGDLEKMVATYGKTNLQNLRKAVIEIRQSKLPDPRKLGNAGSFFKNPIVKKEAASALGVLLPGLPVYPQPDGTVKLGAGFLIEKAGWKGVKSGQAAVHEKQALVLVNTGRATGTEILELSVKIQEDVLGKFGVVLEREVQLVGVT